MKTLLVALLLSTALHANTSIITGSLKDAQGNPINGTLVMRLPIPAQDPLTQAAIANVPVTFQLVNGNVQGGAPLYDLATIQPKKLWYSARAYDTTGALVFYGNYFVTGSTFNIGAASPSTVTTSNISFSNLTTGIASINGDTTQAQTIVGAAGIGVATSSGRTTITGAGLTGVTTFNGTSDAKFDTTCSTVNLSNQLTCTDAPFSSCPAGAVVSVTGGAQDAGSHVVSLITTIQSCNSSTIAIMAANSSNTTASPGTRWGTDNFPALKSQYAAAGANTFVIPPGNYLINTPNGGGPTALNFRSNSEVIFQKGATIFWVGPVGSPNNAEGNTVAFFVPDGTTNVHIRIDGTITGDNVSGGPGLPFLNQSSLITIFNGFTGFIDDINIDGTGLIQFLYGFDVHSLAPGVVNFRDLRINVSAKGTNINSPGWQTNLNLKKSFGIETAVAGSIIAYNTFDASDGISLGGAGGSCNGDVVSNNTFLNTTRATNLFIGDCVYGATITGNAFYVAGSGQAGISINATTFSGEGNNIIANNTFTCGQPFPNQAQAAILSGSSIAPAFGNFFYNNTNAPDPGVTNSYCNYGVLEENPSSVDTFIGGSYKGNGFFDFSVQGTGVSVLAIGVSALLNGVQVSAPATVDPKSSFITSSGILYGSGLGTGFTPAGTSLTTTAATSDNVAITGITSATNCQLTPTNASAATNVATTYVSAKTTNQITVTHTATSGMTYDIQCFIK